MVSNVRKYSLRAYFQAIPCVVSEREHQQLETKVKSQPSFRWYFTRWNFFGHWHGPNPLKQTRPARPELAGGNRPTQSDWLPKLRKMPYIGSANMEANSAP